MDIKIGQLAKRSACGIETIRFYEKEGLLPPPKRSDGNYRLYDSQHLESLLFIRHCRSLGMTLAEIKILLQLRETPQRNCDEVNRLLENHIKNVQERIYALLELQKNLVTLKQKCTHVQTIEHCGILQNLEMVS